MKYKYEFSSRCRIELTPLYIGNLAAELQVFGENPKQIKPEGFSKKFMERITGVTAL